MKPLLFAVAIVTFVFGMCTESSAALTKMGELSEYHKDYADVAVGATVSSPSRVHPDFKLQDIITPKYDGACVFADGVEQREEFTIDLGQVRDLGFFVYEMTRGTVYGGELKRVPGSMTVSISTESPHGPWRQVYKQDPADVIMSFALENVPARWVHFDLGLNTDGVGSRIRKARIYKRYQLQSGPELMKEFSTQFKRDAEGLGEFWKAVDAGDWEAACDRMIEHYAKWPEEGKGQASDRVVPWLQNTVEDGGAVYKFDSTDWDWFRMKTECAEPTLGSLPGASTILHLLKSSYAATGEEKYAKHLAELLRDWLQDIPCPGVHRGQDGWIVSGWAGIVASQRTWSFGEMVHAMFKENKHFDRDLKINLLYSLWEHINYMRHVSRDLGGNWLTNANSCLFNGAVNYPEFVQYREWLEDSKSYFEAGLERDFFPCGREWEDSSMYVPIATNQVTGQYVAMKKAGVVISPAAQAKMDKVWDCFALFHYPDLSVPSIGDAHRPSPLIKSPHAVRQDYLELHDRQDLVFINTKGAKGKAPDQASHGCDHCGWYILRSPWETQPYVDARHMFFKASRHHGHGHRDQMSVTMYAYGRELLTDPGNTAYGVPAEAKVRRTSAHSTVCVDGKDQEVTKARQNAWLSTTSFDYVDAESSPYPGLTHRRQIAFLKSGGGFPDYWLVRDTVTGEGEHRFDLSYHFSEQSNPQLVNGSAVSTFAEGGNVLLRSIDISTPPQIVDANISADRDLMASHMCRFSKTQTAPAGFDTLIMPFKGTKAPWLKAEYLTPDEGNASPATCARITTDNGYDLVLISGKPGTRLSFDNGKIVSDAAVVVIRSDTDGKIIYTHASEGTTTYRGKLLLED